MGSDRKVFNSAELSVHNNAKDCWVTINAKVYDVTNFLYDHPGGDEVLLAAAGKDASEEFEKAGHGSAARLMLDEFYVGESDQPSFPAQVSYTPPMQSHNISDSNKPSEKLFWFLVPLAMVGLAVGARSCY